MSARKYNDKDRGAVVDLLVHHLSDDDTYGYEWPHHDRNDNTQACMTLVWDFLLQRLLEGRSCYVVERDGKVISVAIWEQADPFSQTVASDDAPEGDFPKHFMACFETVGGSLKRRAALAQPSNLARKDLDVAGYERPRELTLMATAKDERRKGAASMLVDIFAQECGRDPAFVVASKMGEALYRTKGFEKVDDVAVQVEGEQERTTVAIMWMPVPGRREPTWECVRGQSKAD